MSFTLSGTCLNSSSLPVAGAVIKVFDTATDTLQGSGTSAGDGSYSISVPIAGPLYAVAYHPNSPDIAGTTLNTLMATASGGAAHPIYFILGF